MKSICLLITFLISVTGFAQQDKLLLKFSPLALADDINFPAVQAGLECRLSNKLSWYNEAGIKYRQGYIEKTDTSFTSSAGFKLKTELRYYLNNIESFSFDGYYFAANLFFTGDRHNTAIEYHIIDSTSTMEDVFAVKRNVLGITFLAGHQKTLSRKWMIDLFAGLGCTYSSISTTNKEFNKNMHGLNGPIDVNIPFMRNRRDALAGSSFMPVLKAGIRLCYKLN